MYRIIYIFLFLAAFANIILGQSPELDKKDIALISEVFHLQEKLGDKVWKNWHPHKTPFLYKKGDFEFLIFHDKPTQDFKISGRVFYKNRIDTLDVEATYPINGIMTVVMTAPNIDESISSWILKACHEMFHVFQFSQEISGELGKILDNDKFAKTSESEIISMFNSEVIKASFRLEADRIYQGINKDSIIDNERNILKKRLEDVNLIQQFILEDDSLMKYKLSTEWTEGVARYVEQKLAILSSKVEEYTPSQDFTSFFPNVDFTELSKRYSQRRAYNPIRFVGSGVRGKLMFYYMGMGKAFLLDRINPDWKSLYFSKTLNQLIINDLP